MKTASTNYYTLFVKPITWHPIPSGSEAYTSSCYVTGKGLLGAENLYFATAKYRFSAPKPHSPAAVGSDFKKCTVI